VPSQTIPGNLSLELLQALQAMKSVLVFAKGATLFRQGYPVTGIYLVEAGEVRILLSTTHTQRQLIEIVGTGTILGLGESLSGEDYRITAEALVPTTVAFIARDTLHNFLSEHPDFSMEVLRLLSEELHSLYHKFRSISSHPGRPRRRELDQQLN
jgi:CRP-like cAMP-binding protein